MSYDLWWILQSDYPADLFAKYVCKYFRCAPFVTNLVATLWQREGPKTTARNVKKIDILYHLLNMDFEFFKSDDLGNFFQSCAEKVLDTNIKYPKHMKYDKNGGIKAMHYLTNETLFNPQQQQQY